MNAQLIQYDEEIHGDHLYDLFMEYGTWLNEQVIKHYNTHLFNPSETEKLTERMVSSLKTVKPPTGIVNLLEVDSKIAGMGRLTKLSEDIAEINGVFVRPDYRGNGFSYLFVEGLEASAREFGYSRVRLDTADFNEVAQHVYRKVGFTEIPRYTEVGLFESEILKAYYENKVYMEKKLE
jgi:GNAT superfamily N-acetyltransferase